MINGDLVGKGSLLYLGKVCEEEIFEIHPLIHEFMRFDLKEQPEEFRRALRVGVDSVHFCIESAAKKCNATVKNPPRIMKKDVR